MLALIVVCLLQLISADCPNGSFQSLTDKTSCYFYVNEKTNFMDADQQCVGLNGNLVSVHNMFENVYLAGEAAKVFTDSTSNDFWIGANSLLTDGTWSWMDGTLFDFNDWDKGQPENKSDTNCASVSLQSSRWSAFTCLNEKPFVCLVKIIAPTSDAITTTTPLKPKSCPDSWTYYNTTGFCYKVLDNSNWLDAEDRCKVDHSHLTSVHSEDEALLLANLAYYIGSNGCNASHQAWFGLYTEDKNVHWKWTDGTPYDYDTWGRGEPDDPGNQNCAFIQLSPCSSRIISKAGDFENTMCNQVLAKFVCKKAPA